MQFGFSIYSSDIDLWDTDFLDTYLDFLYADISSKHFVYHAFKTSSRRLQRNNFYLCLEVFKTSYEMSSRKTKKLLHWRHSEDVFKISTEDQQVFSGKVLNQKIKICDKVLITRSSHKALCWSWKNNNWVVYKWTLNYAQWSDKNLFILFIINLSFG